MEEAPLARHKPRRRRARGATVMVLGALAVLPGAAHPVDVEGSFTLFQTATDNQGIESDLLDQQLNLSLFQRLTPYISLRFGYQYFDFSSESREIDDFSRRSRQPRLEMLYSRRNFSALLAGWQQRTDSNSGLETFEADSLLANLAWKSEFGLAIAVNYRDESNVADQSLFGRDTDSRFFTVDTTYGRRYWSASYSYRNNTAENLTSALRTDQDRHELRANAARPFLNERLRLSFSGDLSRLDRTTRVGEGADPAEPLRPFAGLFAIDTAPEIGELEPAPTLIDGDVETPTDPRIDIGGAATFRNLGVDLGINQPVTRLEIFVDSPSGNVIWEVYRSTDNLFWERVAGVTSDFDPDLLRYTIRLPETVDRYFKAVNVSINSNPSVRVTEIRALIDVDAEAGSERFESTLYRADIGALFNPFEWMTASINFGVTNDQDVSAGFVRRDFSSEQINARISFDMPADLRFDGGYRYADSENLREPVLLRTLEVLGASLTWDPLETVDAVLSVQRRDELEKSTPLQTTESARLQLVTVLLPDLRLVSDFEVASLEDNLAGRDRESRTWRESLEARLTSRWLLSGQFTYSEFETVEGEPLLERTSLDLRTSWQATAYLTLAGVWSWTEDDERRSIRQNYSVTYNPGTKLSLSAVYQEFETRERRVTADGSFTVNYRLNRYFSLFGNLSRSRFAQGAGPLAEVTNLRTGLRLFF